MHMNHILDTINELRATRSKTQKELILEHHKHVQDLREFFRLALNPYINFYCKKKMVRNPLAATESLITFEAACDVLEHQIANRLVTGAEATQLIQYLIDSTSEETSECIKLILAKDPDCGVDTLAEKIWPGVAPKYPCLLASPFKEKDVAKHIDFNKRPYVQLKSDGLRCNVIIDEDGVVKVFTRSGREMDVHGVFDEFADFGCDVVYDGELLTVKPDGQFNDRKTSNGICSKAVKGTMSGAEADTLHLVMWDRIPLTEFKNGIGTQTYEDRFESLKPDMGDRTKIYSIIPSKRVGSLEEVMAFYNEMRAANEEGAMLKCPTMLWEDTRSKKQYKLKAELTADLKVTGFIEGEGKLVGNLGALSVATECNKCKTNISGFSLKARSEIYANLIGQPVKYEVVQNDELVAYTAMPGDSEVKLGSIVEVTYNEKILARDSEVWSLFLPRFSAVRHDKTVANTVDEL